MDILYILQSIEIMVNMPLTLLVLMPVSFALAFQIIKSSEGHKVEAKAIQVKYWEGDKNQNYKPSTTAMLASLVFIVFATFSMYNVANDKPMLSVDMIPFHIINLH